MALVRLMSYSTGIGRNRLLSTGEKHNEGRVYKSVTALIMDDIDG